MMGRGAQQACLWLERLLHRRQVLANKHLNSSRMVRKETPGLAGSPSMVKVLPDPVWP